MNETWPGGSPSTATSSPSTFSRAGVTTAKRERVVDEAAYFEKLWNDVWPDVVVRPLPETAREAVVSASVAGRWPELVDEICFDLDRAARWSPGADKPGGRRPRPHQVAALDAWTERGRRGIFEHATGSGKTFTALCAIADALRRGEVPLVLAPSDLLLKQWEAELRDAFVHHGLQLLVLRRRACRLAQAMACCAASLVQTRPASGLALCFLPLQTASTRTFQNLCVGGDHIFLVADEGASLGRAGGAHRTRGQDRSEARSQRHVRAEGGRSGRHGRDPGLLRRRRATSLHAAGRDSGWCPDAVCLPPHHGAALSRRAAGVGRGDARRSGGCMPARRARSATQGSSAYARFKQLLIRRARIAKSAEAKTPKAVEILREAYAPGQRWIVYCDDQKQLAEVKAALRRRRRPRRLRVPLEHAGRPAAHARSLRPNAAG